MISPIDIKQIIDLALTEDIGSGDLTANLVDPSTPLLMHTSFHESPVYYVVLTL